MLSGPYATMLLGDFGAEVIKIEPPGTGEATRRLLADDPANSVAGMGAYFLTLGRNKKSVTLDIKRPEGYEIFCRLVAGADVVVSNFRAGVAQRIGIDYESLKGCNPRIITCSITGFGEYGPNKDHTSFDLVAQATGGGMSITGNGDSPMRSGIPIGDLGGGLMGALGVLAALQARTSTGRGQHLDVSMQDCQLSLLNYMATMTFLSGVQPPAMGNAHFVHVPYDSFPANDGHIIIAVITDGLWLRCLQAIGLEELNLPEYARASGRLHHREVIVQRVIEQLQTQPSAYWLARLTENGVPCAPVNDIKAALADSHVHARGMIVDVPLAQGGSVKQVGIPVKFSETGEEVFTPPPLLGADTEVILSSLAGVRAKDFAALKEQGVV